MEIKKKRQVVITLVLAVALILHLVMSVFGLKIKIPGGLTNIFFWIYIPSYYVVAFVKRFSELPVLLCLVYWISYIATYLFLGWIAARLIYPSKKDSIKNGVTQG